MKSLKTVIIILIVVILLASIGVTCFAMLNNNGDKEIMKTYKLGTSEMPGYIGAEVYYDVEPVDVALTSPKGNVYVRDYASVYSIDPDSKTVTILADSSEIGEWKLTMNTKGNKSLKFKFINTTSDSLYLKEASIVKEADGMFYIRFCPTMTVTTDESVNYTLSLIGENYNNKLSEGVTKLNDTSYIRLDPPEDAYNGKEYTIRITVQTPDGLQLKHKDMKIKLSTAEGIAALENGGD